MSDPVEPSEPAPGWILPEPASPPPDPTRPTVAVLAGIAVAVAALGVPLGLLWSVVAPDVPMLVTDSDPVFAEPQPEQLVAADGWFAVLAVPVGVLAGAGVWFAARRARGTPGLVTLTAGGIGAGLLAWWLGRHVGLADFRATRAAAEPGTRLARPPDLGVAEVGWWPPHALGVVLVPALAAAATYTLLAAWSRYPALRPGQPVRTHDHHELGDVSGSGPP